MRTAVARTPREASPSSALTERPRPPTGPSVGSGSASVEARPGTQGVPETVTIGRSLPMSASPSAAIAALSSVMAAASASGAAVVAAEREADHAVGLRGAGTQDVEVRQPAAQRLGAGVLQRLRGAVRAGQREDGVAVAEQFGDDGGADGAGAAGDEDVHGSPESDGTSCPITVTARRDPCPITTMRAMARWQPGATQRLVVAAVDLFTEQGYDATTVAQIAERAGVTKSTFFRHFSDKRELLVAGQETLSRLLADGIAEAPAAPAR